jgi:hypothetical protein
VAVGLLTQEAHEDLLTVSRIRNLFAHATSKNTFESEQMRALCNNLRTFKQPFRISETGSQVARSSGRVEKLEAVGYSVHQGVMLQLVDANKLLETPRGQFVATAKLIVAALTIYSEGHSVKPVI